MLRDTPREVRRSLDSLRRTFVLGTVTCIINKPYINEFRSNIRVRVERVTDSILSSLLGEQVAALKWFSTPPARNEKNFALVHHKLVNLADIQPANPREIVPCKHLILIKRSEFLVLQNVYECHESIRLAFGMIRQEEIQGRVSFVVVDSVVVAQRDSRKRNFRDLVAGSLENGRQLAGPESIR